MGAAFLRQMNWLGAGRAQGYLRLLAAMNLAMLGWLLATSHQGIDANGFLLGSDFLSFWTTGRMLPAGSNPYDAAAHIVAQRQFFASSDGFTAFFYPPSFLPFCWPLGLLPYFAALAAWLAATGAAWFAVARAWARACGVSGGVVLALAFPAVPIVITHGQTSFLVAALLGLGLLLVPGRPALAGALLGLATIKPQFGLLVPIALIGAREWRTVAAAAVTALALALAAALAFGPQVWADWIAASGRAQAAMAQGAVDYGKMVSPFAALRLTGAPVALAYAVQGLVTLAVAATVAVVAWRRGWTPGLAALVLAGAPLATPFVLDYDMVLLAAPLLWLAGEGLRSGWRDWEKLALATAFIAPAFARPLALNVGLPIMPLVLAGLFVVVARRLSGRLNSL